MILAGGRATRLGLLSKGLPKYLMPIGDNVTFADAHLAWVKQQGFERVFLSVGYKADHIRAYVGNGERFGLNIEYFDDGATPRGTGGAVALSMLEKFEHLAITYGDTLLDFDVKSFIQMVQADSLRSGMTIYKCKVPGHACNSEWLSHESGADAPTLIYDKLRPDPSWTYIDYGFLCLTRQLIESFANTPTPLDLAEPLSRASRKGEILGFEVKNRFWEIGTPEALEEFKTKQR